MQIRTDLALEQREMHRELPEGVTCEEIKKGNITLTKISVLNKKGSEALKKPIGKYITAEVPPFSDNVQNDETVTVLSEELSSILPCGGTALVVGLGNRSITPDALGPMVCEGVLATRHIKNELNRITGRDGFRSVAVVSPGVLGQTGIEAFNIIKGVCREIKPTVIIAVDALASRYTKRLGCTVQMSNTGIEPGAGVGNARFEISEKTLGIPVVSLGVPTVVDAATLVNDLTGGGFSFESECGKMIVTPREIDLLIDRSAALISDMINFSLQSKIEPELIRSIME